MTATMTVENTTVKQLMEECTRNPEVVVIDVRTPREYGECHARIAKNFPLESLDPQKVINECGVDGQTPIYLMCRSGKRSSQACEKFLQAGFGNVVSVEGGILAWDGAGYDVVRGKKAISLERQMRITAGMMIVIGAVCGLFVDPNWLYLSAFVGCGLIFSGITDKCPLSMVIAKMPWNQACSNNCCSSCN